MTYAELVKERMRSANNALGRPLTLKQLSGHLGRSYEHCRKILRGDPAASEDMNRDLCKLLKLDEQSMWKLAQREKLVRRYPTLAEAPIPDDTLQEMWQLLTEHERAAVIQLVRSMVGGRQRMSPEGGLAR